MDNCEEDILVVLNKNELLELREKYRKHKEVFCYVHTLIDLVIRWKEEDDKISRNSTKIVVTSPKNSWREDGSIVVIFSIMKIGVFPYSLDENYTNIKEALRKTKRINFNTCTFANIHENYLEVITDLYEEKQLPFSYKENFLFVMSIDKAKEFAIECPPEVYVKELDKSHAVKINDAWPHKFPNSQKSVEIYMEYNAAFGLFLKENNELVSWVMQGPLGHINLLQTDVNYFRRGYGEIMLKQMSKYLAETGNISVATVITSNSGSVRLFKKLGFECIGKSYFVFQI